MLAVVLVSVYINITCSFGERFWVGVGSRPQIRQSFKIPACALVTRQAGMTTKADVPTVRASPAASIPSLVLLSAGLR